MRLRRLRLENYRKYRSANIEFPDGIIGIVGRNGAGKSTLIEAIGWCMYGGDAARTNQGEIVASGAPPGATCAVTLDVEMDGEAVTITREIKLGRSTGTARVFLQGRSGAEVTGGQAVSSYMARRTGMDRVAFFSSVFAQQKELAGISGLKDAERKKTVLRLLGIDTVERALALIKGDSRDLRQQIDARRAVMKDEREIKGDLDDLEKKRRDADKRARDSRASAAGLERELKAAEKKHGKLEDKKGRDQARRAALDKALAARESKREDLAEKERELEGLRRDDRKLGSLRPSLRKHEAARKKLERLARDEARHVKKADAAAVLSRAEGRIQSLREESAKISEKLDSARSVASDQDAIRQKMSALQAELDGAREARAAAATDSAKASAEASNLKAERDEIVSLKRLGKCPRCRRTLGNSFAALLASTELDIKALEKRGADRKRDAERLDKQIRSVKSDLDEARGRLEQCQKAEGEASSLEASLASNDSRMGELHEEARAAEAEAKKFPGLSYDKKKHEAAKKELGVLEAARDQALALQERVQRIPAVRNKIRELEKAMRKHDAAIKAEEEAIEKIAFDGAAYAASEAARDQTQGAYHAAREEAIKLEGDLREARLEAKAKRSELEEAKKAASAVKELEGRTESLGLLQGYMDGFKDGLISRIRPALSSRTSDLLRLTTSGKYPAVEFDDSYAVRIASDGGKFGLDRFSGGEQDLVSLCLRIAISKELSERAGTAGARFIVLDEVFGSQDAERKPAILGALAGLSGEFGQILLITHIEDVREALPYALHVIEEGDGSSRIEVESRYAGPAGSLPAPAPPPAAPAGAPRSARSRSRGRHK